MCLLCAPLYGASARKPHLLPASCRAPCRQTPPELPGRLSVANGRVFHGIPAAPDRALRVMVTRVRSCCPKVAMCSPVHFPRPPRLHVQGPEPQAAVGRAGLCLPHRLAEFTAHRPAFQGHQTSDLLAGAGSNDSLRSGGHAGSQSHPVPQDPALAVQLWHLLGRAPGPGIPHVWMVSCQETGWSVRTAAFLHPRTHCPPTYQPTPGSLPTTSLTSSPARVPITHPPGRTPANTAIHSPPTSVPTTLLGHALPTHSPKPTLAPPTPVHTPPSPLQTH